MKHLAWLFGVVLGGSLCLRLLGLGSFMTADESQWMVRSSEFWHTLVYARNPGGTFLTTHPGVVPMWLIGAGEFYRELQLGYEVDSSNLADFRIAALIPMVMASSILVAVIAIGLAQLYGLRVGYIAAFFLSVEPYFVGMSQIAHLDMLLSLFVLAAFVYWLLYLRQVWRPYALIAGIFMGLAFATKFLPAAVACLFFVPLCFSGGGGFIRGVRRLGFFGGVLSVTFFIAWPALWVKDDIWRSFERDTAIVSQQAHVMDVATDTLEPIDPAWFYVRTALARVTPALLLLAAAGAVWILVHWRKNWRWKVQPLFFCIYFLLVISWVGKKSDRYALPALVMFPLLAAFGASWLEEVVGRISAVPKRAKTIVFLSVLVLASAWHLFNVYPYGLAFNSPLFPIRAYSQQGWGEGLDKAAQWVSQLPLGSNLTVASWYPSVFDTFYEGPVMSLSSRQDPRVGAVVLYRNMWGRGDSAASDIIDEYRDKEPAYVVKIAGIPYVWVYLTYGMPYFPKHVGELLPGAEVGQSVTVTGPAWSFIDLGLSTFSGRAKESRVTVHIKHAPGDPDDIRTIHMDSREIQDSDWNRFSFEPILNAQGKTYYVAITTDNGVPNDAITVRYSMVDILPGSMYWRKMPLKAGQGQAGFRKEYDLAYRL